MQEETISWQRYKELIAEWTAPYELDRFGHRFRVG